jgi:hypothetical protein
MVRKLGKQRAVSASVAFLMLVTAVAAGLHTHTWLAQDDLAAQAAHIPLSVIANPDAPAPEQHWHPGTIFEQDLCAACLLAHQRASFVCAFVVSATVAAVRIANGSWKTPAALRTHSTVARAPPFTC